MRARARYRDVTGRTRQLEATSTSATAARRALEAAFSQRMAAAGDLITPSMRVAALAEVTRLGFPRIAGVIQGAMQLRDSAFEFMSHAQWEECLGPSLSSFPLSAL